VNEAIDLCREELARNGISCRTVLEDNLSPVIVDVLQIEQVVFNLLRNAIEAISEAAPADRMIVIEAKRVQSADIEISVRDTGCGFTDGQVDVEFPPFATTKAQGRHRVIAVADDRRGTRRPADDGRRRSGGGRSFYPACGDGAK
jgi:two-component system, LuxR family, sensor kinase FixL